MKLIPVLAEVTYNKTDGRAVRIKELSENEKINLCAEKGYYISGQRCNIKTYMKSANLVFRIYNPAEPAMSAYLNNHREYDRHCEETDENNKYYYFYYRNNYADGKPVNNRLNPNYTAGCFRVDNGEGGEIIIEVHSSNISDNDYTEIIGDLIRIHSRLVEDNLYDSNMSIGDRWEYAAGDLKKQFLRLKSAVREIEKNPDENLEKVFTYAKSHNVKKVTARTVTDIAAGKNKVRTVANETTLAIDEHCIIKSYLENMKKLISRYISMQKSDYMYPARKTEFPVNEEYQRIQNTTKNKIADICRNYEDADFQNTHESLLIYINSNMKPAIREKNSRYEILYIYKNGNYFPFCLDINRYKTKILKISSHCPERAYFFLYCLEKACVNGEMTAYGGVDIQNKGNKAYPDVYLDLDNMEYVVSGNHKITYREFYDYICGNPDRLIDYISAFQENISFINHMENNYQNSLKMQKEAQKNKEELEKLYIEIDSFIKKSEILRNSYGNKKLHSTNLFSMHPSYRRAYAVMKNNVKKFRILEFNENESIKIGDKTVNIYEKWCLIKILSVFTTVYGFSFADKNDSLKDIISRCLQENNTIRGSVFRLECHNPDIMVTIEYDRRVDIYDEWSYRPDFLFTISARDKTYRFCMDAKYKKYSEMFYINRTMTVDDDIRVVAEKKYIDGMKQKYNIDISGSYILHCNEDIPRKIEFKNQGNTSFGAICMTPTNEDENKDFCFLIQMIMEHYFKFYKEKCWVCGSNDIKAEKRLTGGGKEKYNIYCKKCGHFLIETHCHKSLREGNNAEMLPEHRYKIAKHICNTYYALEKNSRWNVKCVECGQTAQNNLY